MEEYSFKCICGDFQGHYSELVNNSDIKLVNILKGFGNVDEENPEEQVLKDVWLPVHH